MKKLTIIIAIFTIVAMSAGLSWATNGDNLIGVGPTSRSMGGVGVASPQDSISAIFANPAAMCFGAYCPGSEATFAGTYFNPTVDGKVDYTALPGYPKGESDSQMDPFVVPAIGISTPLTSRLRFGIGAYGVSGMGVNYKEEDIPVGDMYTKLEVMKFAPNLAYLVTSDFSVGASLSVSYQNLDLGTGGAHGYAYGAQLGALYHFNIFNFGVSYTTPQKVTHENVYDFDQDSTATNTDLDDLDLEAPQTMAFGVSAEPNDSLLVEFNTKWINWSDADGYKDFDWDDQWVFAVGAQYKVTQALALRIGYNYGKNPVNEHNGFNPMGSTDVQGTDVSNVNYETFRIIGFPAIIEHHLTLGAGYKFTDKMAVNISYMHGFEETIKESSEGVPPTGNTVDLESTLQEDSVSVGFTVQF
ncbi:OmpP1/FadL family transporter [Thermodesulfobacteriota bacterium]